MRATNSFAPKREEPKVRESIAESTGTRTSFGDFGGSEGMKNTKSILYIILVFLGMGYAGITFIFSIVAYQDTSSKTWNISQIVSNWKQTPIVAISASNNDKCATGYEPITGYTWPGTFEGCYCDDTVPEEKLKNALVKGECDRIQNNNGCSNIDEKNPVIVRKFYNDLLICVQRSGDNIIDTQRPTQHGESSEYDCPDGFIKCGPEQGLENQI